MHKLAFSCKPACLGYVSHRGILGYSIFKLRPKTTFEPNVVQVVISAWERNKLASKNSHTLSLTNSHTYITKISISHFLQLLNFIASRHKDNLMDSSNLAIVLAPSIMPLPAASTAQRLEHHVALVKVNVKPFQNIFLIQIILPVCLISEWAM